MKNFLKLFITLSFLPVYLLAQETNVNDFPMLKGEYLGQKKPGIIPEVFAPGIVSTKRNEKKIVFTKDGSEAFWSREIEGFRGEIMTMRIENGKWISPERLPFSTGEYFDHNVVLSHDGNALYFASDRPVNSILQRTIPNSPGIPASNLWVSKRTNNGWSEPVPLDSTINTEWDEDCPTLAEDGTLYFISMRPASPGFANIYSSRFESGHFMNPQLLPSPINTIHGELIEYVAADQSYIIFRSHRPGGYGVADLYISYRDRNEWGEPINLGKTLNVPRSRFVELTPDGKYLFFVRDSNGNADIHWVDAKIIEELKPKNWNKEPMK